MRPIVIVASSQQGDSERPHATGTRTGQRCQCRCVGHMCMRNTTAPQPPRPGLHPTQNNKESKRARARTHTHTHTHTHTRAPLLVHAPLLRELLHGGGKLPRKLRKRHELLDLTQANARRALRQCRQPQRGQRRRRLQGDCLTWYTRKYCCAAFRPFLTRTRKSGPIPE